MATWGVFVGKGGDQLKIFNSRSGPFPPEKGTEGYIAIGWPAVGNLSMYKDNYLDYLEKFRIVYGRKYNNERQLTAKVNMPWYFAYEMQIGDTIISPCSSEGLALVGKVSGDYETDFHDELGLRRMKRADFVHIRKVEWERSILQSDPEYKNKNLNRLGRLTVFRTDIDL